VSYNKFYLNFQNYFSMDKGDMTRGVVACFYVEKIHDYLHLVGTSYIVIGHVA
jgi:hypothetical protein